MPAEPGNQIVDFLRKLQRDARFSAQAIEDLNTKSRWRLRGSTWQAEAIIDPPRWLGLIFETTDTANGRTVSYAIDTDLYAFDRPQHRAFARDIEDDIIEFLENLVNERMLRSQQTPDVILVFPLRGSFVRVETGRFMTSTSTHILKADAMADDFYMPVT